MIFQINPNMGLQRKFSFSYFRLGFPRHIFLEWSLDKWWLVAPPWPFQSVRLFLTSCSPALLVSSSPDRCKDIHFWHRVSISFSTISKLSISGYFWLCFCSGVFMPQDKWGLISWYILTTCPIRLLACSKLLNYHSSFKIPFTRSAKAFSYGSPFYGFLFEASFPWFRLHGAIFDGHPLHLRHYVSDFCTRLACCSRTGTQRICKLTPACLSLRGNTARLRLF